MLYLFNVMVMLYLFNVMVVLYLFRGNVVVFYVCFLVLLRNRRRLSAV